MGKRKLLSLVVALLPVCMFAAAMLLRAAPVQTRSANSFSGRFVETTGSSIAGATVHLIPGSAIDTSTRVTVGNNILDALKSYMIAPGQEGWLRQQEKARKLLSPAQLVVDQAPQI